MLLFGPYSSASAIRLKELLTPIAEGSSILLTL
jgi:hypothetical protein